MIIGSIKEKDLAETRVALTPDVAKKMVLDGHTVFLQTDFGKRAGFQDADYRRVGVDFFENSRDILEQSRILLQIFPPELRLLQYMGKDSVLVADTRGFDVHFMPAHIELLRLEKVQRISMLQSVDILSTQTVVRGYMAAMHALYHSLRIAPQMMTAAVSFKSAEALIIGSGICGLQAASVFKRNGCRTTVIDINEQNREQALSVGAEFYVLNDNAEWGKLLHNKDFVLAAAQTSEGISPQIIANEQLKYLAKGTVVIDTTENNIGIRGYRDVPEDVYFCRNLYFERLAPTSASVFWANNMYNLILLIGASKQRPDLDINQIQSMRYKVSPVGVKNIYIGG